MNGETYFFRDPASLRAFSEEIAPERLLAAGRPDDALVALGMNLALFLWVHRWFRSGYRLKS